MHLGAKCKRRLLVMNALVERFQLHTMTAPLPADTLAPVALCCDDRALAADQLG